MKTLSEKENILITTAIDYVNGVIHLGHAYQKILADAVVRFYRLSKGENGVFFVTGTDEHGQKVVSVAEELGRDIKDYVDEIAIADQQQQDSLNSSYDRFIRTTDEDHKKQASEFFKKVYDNGYIYKGTFEGLYCEGCEEYKTEKDLVDGKCPLHPTKEIVTMEEENYFFKWSAFKDFLKEHFEKNPNFVIPETRAREMLAFIDEIEDIPVTRTKEKLPWGIECPIDSEHVLWVWFDALLNYLTFGNSKGIWNEKTGIVHFIGKDIARMHALLWPAMLKAANEEKLPDQIYVTAFLSIDGQKISKSLGNVIRPTELVEKYGVDPVRYYLLKHGPIREDANFSFEHFEEIYNGDLANGLGNTVARIAKLAEKANENHGIEFESIEEKPLPSDLWSQDWAKPIENFQIDFLVGNIREKLTALDKHINENEPWKIENAEKLQGVLQDEIDQLRIIATIFEPIIPDTAKRIQAQFAGKRIKAEEALFPRI